MDRKFVVIHTTADDERFLKMCKVLNDSQQESMPEWTELGKSSLANLDQFKDVILILQHNAPVASVAIKNKDGVPYVGRICVKPELRGLGLGKLICEEAEKFVVNRGHKSLRLDVGEHLKPARNLYKKLGYQEIGKKETRGGFIDIIMEKELQESLRS